MILSGGHETLRAINSVEIQIQCPIDRRGDGIAEAVTTTTTTTTATSAALRTALGDSPIGLQFSFEGCSKKLRRCRKIRRSRRGIELSLRSG